MISGMLPFSDSSIQLKILIQRFGGEIERHKILLKVEGKRKRIEVHS